MDYFVIFVAHNFDEQFFRYISSVTEEISRKVNFVKFKLMR